MTAQYILSNQQVFDINGTPISGAKLYFFEAGTTTPLTSYSESTLSTANAHPVVADSSGRFADIYLPVDEYRVRLDDANDVTIFTNDPYSVPLQLTSGAGLETSGTSVNQVIDTNDQTGTSYTFLNSDQAKLVTFSNAAATAVTLPQAGASSEFIDKWFCYFTNLNDGLVTITPTTSTINSASSLKVPKGMGGVLISDGSNYKALLWKNVPTYPDDGELTIATGAITVTGPNHTVDTESDASSDDLDTINGGIDGMEVTLTPASGARTVVVKNGTGNIEIGTDVSLSEARQTITLKYYSAASDWRLKALGTLAPAPTIQVFTSSGTWNRPAGCQAVRATVVAAGGGGGGGNGTGSASGGGGAGGAAVELIDVTGTASASVTVGTGGGGGALGINNGSAGGTSSFGAFCSATGGSGGQGVATGGSGTGGAGGAGSGGSFNLTGQNGRDGNGSGSAASSGGDGGTSYLAGGGRGATSSFAGAGENGENYGAGGGGVYGGAAGGDGAGGIVIVEEFY